MNLTPISMQEIPRALNTIRAALDADSVPARALDRIARTVELYDAPYDTAEHQAAAVNLARYLGIPTIDEPPSAAFSWDGSAIRTRSEAYVLIHEVAHWQIAPAERRNIPDFGLGAGPETGRVKEANAARCVPDDVKEREELLASLLGILWETSLGHPAIHAFIEQNWLEAWDRSAAAEQYAITVAELHARGLIDADGAPYEGNAATAAISSRNSGQARAETSTIADAGPSDGK